MNKISAFQIGTHDFRKEVRVLNELLPGEKLTEKIVAGKQKAQNNSSKLLVYAAVGAFLLATGTANFNIKIPVVENLTVPLPLLIIGVAFLLGGCVLNLLNFFVLNEYLRVAIRVHYGRTKAPAFLVPYESDNAWTLGILPRYDFINLSDGSKHLASMVYFLMGIPYLIVLVLVAYIVVGSTVLVLDASLPIGFATMTVVAVSSLILFPMALALLLFLPMQVAKNKDFVRWNFLSGIARRDGIIHQNAENWRKQSKRLD